MRVQASSIKKLGNTCSKQGSSVMGCHEKDLANMPSGEFLSQESYDARILSSMKE
jgi:hypothetical protein